MATSASRSCRALTGGRPSLSLRGSAACRAFTILELMVVLAILGIIALIFLPMQRVMRDNDWRPVCGDNQRQIVLAMGVYANENDGVWPCRPTLRNGRVAPGVVTADGMATAIASFEFVVAQTGGQLRSLAFACPQTPKDHPLVNSANPKLDGTSASISNWVTGCGCTNALFMPGYCYDWSVPTNANALRVVMADRGFDSMGHQNVSVVCYADNHVGTVKQTRGVAPKWPMTVPFAMSATPASVYETDPSAQLPDNIYDGYGDDGDASAAGMGSTTRAWVR